MALAEAKRLGCTYADIRFTRNRSHGLNVRNGQLDGSAGGAGGFGDDRRLRDLRLRRPRDPQRRVGLCEQPDRHARRDSPHRRPSRPTSRRPARWRRSVDVQLAPVPAYDTFWETPIKTDPWDVPLEEKLALLADDDRRRCRRTRTCCSRRRTVDFKHEWKFLATSEGSFIEQVFYYTTCGCTRDGAHQGQVKIAHLQPGSTTRGYEFVARGDLPGNAERVAAEAVEHAMAKPVGAG